MCRAPYKYIDVDSDTMKNEALVKRIALCRIKTLFELAGRKMLNDTETSRKLAKRYIDIARKISTHYKVKIPRELKYKICKKCGSLLVPGVNCRVRVASAHGYVAYVCDCGGETHIHYKPKSQ
jgi:ribonuclease P protein subunit RPR2